MSTLSKTYNPAEAEAKWYPYWMKHKLFASKPNPDKKPYTMVIPPPNVTGVLHMGHMLNNTIQDILVRRARMQGFEACWVPGTDHASIATEAKVVALLAEQGISKQSLSREDFLAHAWQWKEKYGGIILEQLRTLGASCDWDRTRFTMEEDLSQAVIDVFVDLYNKGLIYRGVRMVNWDPLGRTALSDEEVYHKEVQSRLVYINYPLADGSGHLTIATTRPETIFADVAICANPADERYTAFIGKKVRIPLLGKEITVIADDYVDAAFGTGILKITPAHDINDYEIGLRHNLPVIDLLNLDGTLNEHGERYAGMDRFAVRKQIIKDLEAEGYVAKIEEISNTMGYSERTHAVIEPRLSLQWFLSMERLSKPALDAVMNDTIKLHPPKFKNMYASWMENVRDWCISRQLWWGQRIPAYYLPDGKLVVANTPELALEKAKALNPDYTQADLKQDEDVLDTWFSSWLWPISVFDGFKNPENPDINYYYPTNDLVTAPEILFFWVARMIIAGYEYKGEAPFKNVYLTGIVRDKQGRKMSKSLGNSPDPLDLIKKYGADGVRTGMLFSSPAGNDLPFDERLCEQGRNFANKCWNAFRLLDGLLVDENASLSETESLAIIWMQNRFNQVLADIEDDYSKYRLSEALGSLYNLIWDDFCAWYLELVKPAQGATISLVAFEATKSLLVNLVKVLHPFMPFISEEIYQALKERAEGESICTEVYPIPSHFDLAILNNVSLAFSLVTEIRNLRASKGLSPKESLELFITTSQEELYKEISGILTKLANISAIHINATKPIGAVVITLKADEIAIPMAGNIDPEKEKVSITSELEYTQGFLASVNKKLENEKFVANAKPEVLAKERQKASDALARIAVLEQQLAAL